MTRPLELSWNILRAFPALLVTGYSEIQLARVRQVEFLHDGDEFCF